MTVIPFPKRRRSTPFPVIVALVLVIGAGIGVGTHYAMENGVVDKMIDTMQTAAVDIQKADVLRAKVIQQASTPPKVSKRFDLCSGGYRVTCVVDGDTLWIDHVKIRVADIDAPEVSKPRCAPEKALGDRATRRLLQLVNNGPFEVLEFGSRDEDRYGRKLRVLVRDGRSLGDQLVAEGLARTWTGRREPWC